MQSVPAKHAGGMFGLKDAVITCNLLGFQRRLKHHIVLFEVVGVKFFVKALTALSLVGSYAI